MVLTDEDYLDAFLSTKTYPDAARKAGVSKQRISQKIHALRGYGVHIPETANKAGNPRHKYTPDRVSELNEFVQRYDTNTK